MLTTMTIAAISNVYKIHKKYDSPENENSMEPTHEIKTTQKSTKICFIKYIKGLESIFFLRYQTKYTV